MTHLHHERPKRLTLFKTIFCIVLTAFVSNSRSSTAADLIPCDDIYAQLPERLKSHDFIYGSNWKPQGIYKRIEMTDQVLREIARGLRDKTSRFVQTSLFNRAFPIEVYENGLNLKADYFVRDLFGSLSPAEALIDSNTIRTEFDDILRSVRRYPTDISKLIDKEAQIRMQLALLQDRLRTTAFSSTEPKFKFELPLVRNGQVMLRNAEGEPLYAPEFDKANLIVAIKQLKDDLSTLSSWSYNTVGSYKQTAAAQVINLKKLETIREMFNREVGLQLTEIQAPGNVAAARDIVSKSQLPNSDITPEELRKAQQLISLADKFASGGAQAVIPEEIARRIADIDQIIAKNGRISKDYAPPEAAFQKIKWRRLRKELRGLLGSFNYPSTGGSTFLWDIPAVNPNLQQGHDGGFFGRFRRQGGGQGRMVRGGPFNDGPFGGGPIGDGPVDPGPIGGPIGGNDPIPLPGITPPPVGGGTHTIPGPTPKPLATFHDWVAVLRNMDHNRRAALGFNSLGMYYGLAQPGMLLTSGFVGFNLLTMDPVASTAQDYYQMAMDILFSIPEMRRRECAHMPDGEFERCVTTYIKSRFLRNFMYELAKTSQGVSVLDKQQGMLSLDPKKLPLEGTREAQDSYFIRKKTGEIMLSPDISPKLGTMNGIKNDPDTGALLIDPRAITASTPTGIAHWELDANHLVLNIAVLLKFATKGMITLDPETKNTVLDPKIMAEITKILALRARHQALINMESDVNSSLEAVIADLDPGSETAMLQWALDPDVALFKKKMLAYFQNRHPLFYDSAKDLIVKTIDETDLEQKGKHIQEIMSKIKNRHVGEKVCEIINIRENNQVICGTNTFFPFPMPGPGGFGGFGGFSGYDDDDSGVGNEPISGQGGGMRRGRGRGGRQNRGQNSPPILPAQ